MANIVEPYVKVQEVVRRVPNLLPATGTSNIGVVIVAPVGPQLAYIEGPAQFLSNYTVDGQVPRNADVSFINAYYLSFFSGLVVSRSMNTTATEALLVFSDETAPVKVPYKDGQLLTKSIDVGFTVEEDEGEEVTEWSFVLNDVVFFKGSYETVTQDPDYELYETFLECETLSDIAVHVTGWKEAVASISGSTLSIRCTQFLELTTDDTINKGITVIIPRDSTTGELTFDDPITVTSDKWLFAVIATTPQSTDLYKLSTELISGDTKLFTLKFTRPDENGDDKVDSYMVSLFPTASDLNGSNAFIENLNTMTNTGFKVIAYQTDVLPSQALEATPFGSSGISITESKKAVHLNKALSELEDQALYDIEYLAPVGITDLSFIKRYIAVGRANKWFTPVDVPYDRTNASSIQQYFKNIDNNSNVYACGPFDKNSGLTGWINYIACSTLYYERVMTNKSIGAEFAPVFDEEFGTVLFTNPTYELGKIDREKLLNFGSPINFAMYNQRANIYYMNNNLTHQNVQDILSEEQNRRLVNKIQKDLIKLLGQFKGKYNTNSTRENVNSLINYYFNSTIMTQQFSPDAFEIICDESNNPPEIIRANKLAVIVRVRLYNSIKYIEVLNEVYPIGVDFNS